MTVNPASAPIYRQIKAAIAARIRNGEWSEGALIPGEADLAQRFGCARVTVNRALQELAAEGLVERRRRAGTRVRARSATSAKVTIRLVRQEIEERGAVYRYDVLERAVVAVPDSAQTRLALPAGTSALYIRCLHYADDRPFQLEDRWVNLATVPQAKDRSFNDVGPNEWLVRHVPFTRAEHEFTAANATSDVARLLQLAERDAVFVIDRRTWHDNRSITWVRLFYPGRDYRMVTGLI